MNCFFGQPSRSSFQLVFHRNRWLQRARATWRILHGLPTAYNARFMVRVYDHPKEVFVGINALTIYRDEEDGSTVHITPSEGAFVTIEGGMVKEWWVVTGS